MKITSQEEYGLRCLLRVARASEGSSLTIPEIAAAEGLSHPYVAKLLGVMRQGGLVDSERGRSGGYRLAGSPEDIHLGIVLRALGEPLFNETEFCQRHAGSEAEGGCVHLGSCTVRSLWQTLEFWLRHALDQISLADLLQNEGTITELLRVRLAEAVQESPPTFVPLTALNIGNKTQPIS